MNRLQILIFCLAVAGVSFARMNSNYSYASERVVFAPPLSNEVVMKGLAGPVPGLYADIKVLDVFSVYQAIKQSKKSEYSMLMATYLNQSSLLDPYFFDVYRLASSLLVYDANLPEEAVALLDRGSLVLTDSWEIPFYGGFIAYQQLGDNEKAFELMNRVIGRKHTPPMAIDLAANFLSHSQTKRDAILFLQGLRRSMPEAYRSGIDKKIHMLEQELVDDKL